MRFAFLLTLALALSACADRADPPPPAEPSQSEPVGPDIAPETRVATETELIGTYECQMGPGEVIAFEQGGRFVVTDYDGAQHEGSWALRSGILTVTTSDSTYTFPDLRFEAAVLTLSTGREGPGSAWVCAER